MLPAEAISHRSTKTNRDFDSVAELRPYTMLFSTLVSGLFLSSFVAAAPPPKSKRAASVLPLSTKGRDIIDAHGHVFHFKSTNWPGHQEIMIPEGLQHSSIKDIVSWFPKFGLNSVRFTFAIEMIDDIYNNSPNQTLEKSVINALGQTNGTVVLNQILKKNPEFTKDTTRLEVWDAVGKELLSGAAVTMMETAGLAKSSSTWKIGFVD
ncbi:hypothetical protein LEMA_P015890.1 [Plenodomus lingam JN3]|uniref:Uncharacterized protein n=1 Tax=Leptosphaeria maculans (strain JN3 / isolate v23.1.3 / race Av1-4-5-6-7-8) TaxID=985895 RepID=E5A9W8_LEPMJ|nr:hypothetical protein LEMA_P015890.1 [Plenodomus lingam JN3]CBY00459.1 hypothetical protein LEMA_P015890.1 [Plenodomus lingam JN3]